MKNNSGEIVIGLLVGLAIGAAMLYIQSGNWAQEQANALGREVNSGAYLGEEPGKSVMTIVAPAAAGAGIGWLLDELSSDDSGRTTSIRVNNNDGSININVGDSSEDNDTTTRTDNQNNNSQNQ